MGAGARAGSGTEGGRGSHRGGVGVDAALSAAAGGFDGGTVGLVGLWRWWRGVGSRDDDGACVRVCSQSVAGR